MELNTITLDHHVDASVLSENKLDTNENNQSSLSVNLFGEPIFQSAYVSNSEYMKKYKQHCKQFVISPVKIPDKIFFPTSQITKQMKTAQVELQSLESLNKNSSGVSVISNDNINISGIQNLIDYPLKIAPKPYLKNVINDKNNTDMSSILKGIFAFIDCKTKDDRSGNGIKNRLINLGAKIEKTFNRKVTHVVFYNGYRSTYKKAIERKIPLVSALWVKNCKLAKQILDPVNYPPVDIEKYTVIKERKPVYEIQKGIRIFKKKIKEKKLLEENLKKRELKKKMKEERDIPCTTSLISMVSEPLYKHLNVIPYDLQEKQTLEYCGPPLPKIDSDLVKIEDRLNLNSQKPERLPELLFPTNEELLNMSINNSILTSTQNLRNNSSPEKKIEASVFPTEEIVINKSYMTSETPKDSVPTSKVLQTIACTGMSKCEVKIIKLSVENLGTFVFHASLKPSTTYLVTKLKSENTKSFDLAFAMAFGCYIISEDWIHDSYKMGKWLSREKYLITNLSEPIKEFQTRRQTNSSSLKLHIFDHAGRIYILDSCKPSIKQLKQLIVACGGKCTNIKNKSTVMVGYTRDMIYYIHEKWIFDCIIEGKLLSTSRYILCNSNN